MVTTTKEKLPRVKNGSETTLSELENSNLPHDILEAYQRERGPYTIQNSTFLLGDESLELYNGWLVWQEVTDMIERRVAALIQEILSITARAVGWGQALPDQCECLLADGDTIKPDVCLISKQRFESKVKPVDPKKKKKELHFVLQGGPELVVEIRSPSNRRTQEATKRDKYFSNGTLVVWDVDYIEHKIWVYEVENPEQNQEYVEGDEITCERLLPGWHRPVADFFNPDLTAEQIVGEVAAQWRAESEQKGRIEGELEILRKVIMRQAELRFGAPKLPPDLQTRLASYDVAQLTNLTDTLATSSSLKKWLTSFPSD